MKRDFMSDCCLEAFLNKVKDSYEHYNIHLIHMFKFHVAYETKYQNRDWYAYPNENNALNYLIQYPNL